MPCSSSQSRKVLKKLRTPLHHECPFHGPTWPYTMTPSTSEPDQRHGNQRLPAEAHDLVVAVARKGRPQPQEHEHRHQGLQSEPEEARLGEPRSPGQPAVERRQPAAEEEHHGERRDQDHVDVFGDEEQRERHPRIVDVESGDDLRFALGHVERRAVGLGHARDEIHQSSGNSQNQFQREQSRPAARRTMSPMLRLPEAISTPTMAKPMAIS